MRFCTILSASRQKPFLFDESSTGAYVRVFGDGTETYTAIPVDEFRLRSSIWWISEEFSRRLKEDRQKETNPVSRAALERKWFLLFMARLALQRTFQGEGYKADLRKHYRGEWRLGESGAGE